MNPSSPSKAGFTLVELMVSTAIIALIMLVLVAMTNQTSQTWRSTTEKIEKFQSARDGFESMTRKLSQATLNVNWDYLDKNGLVRSTNFTSNEFKNFIPATYGRVTDLRFVSGPMNPTSLVPKGLASDNVTRPGQGVFFQAPFGLVNDKASYGAMDNLLNTWGYFVEAGYDQTTPQFVANTVPQRWRTRLIEFMQPAENMSAYNKSDFSYAWFQTGMANPLNRRVLAENILTLIILPKLSKMDEDTRVKSQNVQASYLSPYYVYDSYPVDSSGNSLTINPGATPGSEPGMINPKNQLPPVLSVTMIAVDERSAERLDDKYSKSPVLGIDLAAAKAGVDYSSLFTSLIKNPFEGPDGDLARYEKILQSEKVTYRIFTSNVNIRGAKWSRLQTK